MGILNATPDSFSDGGLHSLTSAAIDAGLRMVEAGAEIIDVGGESTRPGSNPVESAQEIARIVPVVQGLAEMGVKVSIDTMKAPVAEAALDAGATFINDVSAGRDPAMLPLAAKHGVEICLMHMQGDPRTMQIDPQYRDVVAEVAEFLLARAEAAMASGIAREKIWLDPGIGFGKTVEHNVVLLRATATFVALGFPVLIGASRKGFLGRLASGEEKPLPVDQREEATLAAHAISQLAGAKMIRTHDVGRGVRFARTLASLS
ncbi:dihydropteroate synthase [bacterium]|nr:MAG: dihydropteroate synthase [bacterium]